MIALTRPLPELAELAELVVELAGTPVGVAVVAVARNATSVVRSVTSRVTAPRAAAPMAAVVFKATRADTVVDTVVDAKVVRLATPVVDMDTCRATAPKARNATTVSQFVHLPSSAVLRCSYRW